MPSAPPRATNGCAATVRILKRLLAIGLVVRSARPALEPESLNRTPPVGQFKIASKNLGVEKPGKPSVALVIGYDKPEHWWEFPNQRYFMNHGPYANDTMYLVHLIAAVVTAGLLYALLFATYRRSSSAASNHSHPPPSSPSGT